jgi:hypothetical protein
MAEIQKIMIDSTENADDAYYAVFSAPLPRYPRHGNGPQFTPFSAPPP